MNTVNTIIKRSEKINSGIFKNCTIHLSQKLAGCEAFPLAVKALYELIEEGLEDENNIYDDHMVIYLKHKDKVMGILTYHFLEDYCPKRIFINSCYVDKPYRGKGLIAYMINALKEIAAIGGVQIIEFGTSFQNMRMQRLAIKGGFVPSVIWYRLDLSNKNGSGNNSH